jgi:hypothetical protein
MSLFFFFFAFFPFYTFAVAHRGDQVLEKELSSLRQVMLFPSSNHDMFEV